MRVDTLHMIAVDGSALLHFANDLARAQTNRKNRTHRGADKCIYVRMRQVLAYMEVVRPYWCRIFFFAVLLSLHFKSYQCGDGDRERARAKNVEWLLT